MTQTFWQNSLEFINGLEIIFDENRRIKSATYRKKKNKNRKITKAGFQTINFRDVSYSADGFKILNDINLTIRSNKVVGIIGPSGSGKTTLINLLAGLLETSSGEVHIDGVDMHDIDTRQWQNKVGYVTQEANLFNKSFYENVIMKRELTEQDKLKCHHVITLVGLAEFVEASDQGYKRYIGEGGCLLSGGQRQRLALARELFKEPQLLILDEATSALDEETETFILEKISQLKYSTTIIFVSHDPKHIKLFDSCYRITSGASDKLF